MGRLGKSDVRIVYYGNVNKKKFKHGTCSIKFYDGLEQLLDCPYVQLQFDVDKIYFIPCEISTKKSFKLSSARLQVTREALQLKEFEGDYPLKYDNEIGNYYVKKSDRLEVEKRYTNSNVPHLNYKSHVNKRCVEESNTVIVPHPVRKYNFIVYEGLLDLLKIQIVDLDKVGVFNTITTIRDLIDNDFITNC